MKKNRVSFTREALIRNVQRFPEARILVVGDIMIDEYVWGKCTRISPEAPVPVVEVEKKTFRPGGAANVAANISALGARVAVAGIIGQDFYGETLLALLKEEGVGTAPVIKSGERPTTVKSRIMAHNQQIARTDIEVRQDIDQDVRERAIASILKAAKNCNVVVFSDYAKGFLTKPLIDRVLSELSKRKIKTLVDPKLRNFYNFRGATLIKPNMKEVSEVLGRSFENEESFIDAGFGLLHDLSVQALIVTRGESGMSLFTADRCYRKIETSARTVYDVTGAGDTVIAALACSLAVDEDFVKAAVIANKAAGIVVGKLGTATVRPPELLEEIKQSGGPM